MSIIVNNYNYGRFLPDAINSALHQTYREIEVIVVDDGSTDDSPDIILGYGHQITPILKENGGQASAFNAGFAHSHGEVVIFLDSDDMLLPHTVQRVAAAFHANPDSARVQYRMEVIDALGRRTGTIKPHRHLPLPSGDLQRHILTFPDDMPWMPTSGNAFAARVLRQILPIPEQVYGRVGADWYVSHLSPLFGPVVFLDEIGAYYRVHGDNTHEVAGYAINFEHIRRTIVYSSNTHVYIKRFADQLGLSTRFGVGQDAGSVSAFAHRLISLKLDPLQHPIEGDGVWRLALLGVIASLRRFDVPWSMRFLFLSWFLIMLPAPNAIARWLAEKFLFPEKRGQFNKILQTFHRDRMVI